MEILKTRRDVAPAAGRAPLARFLNAAGFDTAFLNHVDRSYPSFAFVRASAIPTSPHPNLFSLSLISTTLEPIYAWQDGDVIYWYTRTRNVELNADSGNLFSYVSGSHIPLFRSIDLSGVATPSEPYWDASFMFYGQSSLTTIYASRGATFATQMQGTYMFEGCTSLVGGAGTPYSSSHTDGTYARIDNPPTAPGYFTEAT